MSNLNKDADILVHLAANLRQVAASGDTSDAGKISSWIVSNFRTLENNLMSGLKVPGSKEPSHQVVAPLPLPLTSASDLPPMAAPQRLVPGLLPPRSPTKSSSGRFTMPVSPKRAGSPLPLSRSSESRSQSPPPEAMRAASPPPSRATEFHPQTPPPAMRAASPPPRPLRSLPSPPRSLGPSAPLPVLPSSTMDLPLPQPISSKSDLPLPQPVPSKSGRERLTPLPQRPVPKHKLAPGSPGKISSNAMSQAEPLGLPQPVHPKTSSGVHHIGALGLPQPISRSPSGFQQVAGSKSGLQAGVQQVAGPKSGLSPVGPYVPKYMEVAKRIVAQYNFPNHDWHGAITAMVEASQNKLTYREAAHELHEAGWVSKR